eukprot:14324030-Ditylum_brightwellii.AAC.1
MSGYQKECEWLCNIPGRGTSDNEECHAKCAQDMLYVKRLLEDMELQVELPMILEINNSGAVDLANNW